MRKKTIRLSEAATLLNCSRNTMHKIVADEGMKKWRLRDTRTSPWMLETADVERYRQQRLEIGK